MKKKGFTLVELLAVIAILAILVIVAMPNVLGLFNQAKVSSFVTEIQKIMDTAIATFTKDALLNSGKTVYYSSTENATLGTKKLDMSGNEKNYFIEMDRNGEFKRVVVYDANYCYDIYTTDSMFTRKTSVSKFIRNKIEKTSVFASDVWETGTDSVIVNIDGTDYSINGCEGIITTEGKDKNETTSIVNIYDVVYEYVPGMTWRDWVQSRYNTGDYKISRNSVSNASDYQILTTTSVCDENDCMSQHYVTLNDQIIKNEKYDLIHPLWTPVGITIEPGDKYYDSTDNGGVFIYEQELITSDTYR